MNKMFKKLTTTSICSKTIMILTKDQINSSWLISKSQWNRIVIVIVIVEKSVLQKKVVKSFLYVHTTYRLPQIVVVSVYQVVSF